VTRKHSQKMMPVNMLGSARLLHTHLTTAGLLAPFYSDNVGFKQCLVASHRPGLRFWLVEMSIILY